MTAWVDVWNEHQKNVGFVEGPRNNQNPWTEELGIGDTQYCAAAATTVPHHQGVQWWADSQFGVKGFAYCPFLLQTSTKHGCWGGGRNVDLRPGDIVLFDWGGNGVADHAETVVAVFADSTFNTVGYNTGSPQGCHYPIRRDRKYLLGRVRMEGTFYSSPIPPPVGGNVAAGYPFHTTTSVIQDWTVVDGHGWLIDANGAVYASPGSQGIEGVNGKPYFAGRTAAKLHVRSENGVYVGTVEATSGELYRPDGGTPFRTH